MKINSKQRIRYTYFKHTKTRSFVAKFRACGMFVFEKKFVVTEQRKQKIIGVKNIFYKNISKNFLIETSTYLHGS